MRVPLLYTLTQSNHCAGNCIIELHTADTFIPGTVYDGVP